MPKHPPPPPPHRHVPSSAISGFIQPEQIEQLFVEVIPDPADREFVVRCMVGEGPAHHRGANYVLLALLGRVSSAAGATTATEGEAVPVRMRLPPHLRAHTGDARYALPLYTGALRELAGGDERKLEAMVDCLTDGPPQHALANVAMVALLEGLLRRFQVTGA
jgi:hypothetical protein